MDVAARVGAVGGELGGLKRAGGLSIRGNAIVG